MTPVQILVPGSAFRESQTQSEATEASSGLVERGSGGSLGSWQETHHRQINELGFNPECFQESGSREGCRMLLPQGAHWRLLQQWLGGG